EFLREGHARRTSGLETLQIALGMAAVVGAIPRFAVPGAGLGRLGALAASGSTITSAALLKEHADQFQVDRAAAGSAISSAQAIAAEEPGLLWLALDIAG